MNVITRHTALALALSCCSGVLLAGCISVGIGNGESSVQAQYRIDDLAPLRARAGTTN